MKPGEILLNHEHRTLPLPKGKWIIYQEWHNVLFVHWAVHQDLLRSFVPEELEIQTFNDSAWVSLVVFRLVNVRPRFLPPFPPISNADEINIRTYVEFRGKPGIYFLSMEMGKAIPNAFARILTGLPYRYSRTENTENSYASKNNKFGDAIDIEYQVRDKLHAKSDLDLWLTERHALFQDNKRGAIIEFEIHHVEWPLYAVALKKYSIQYKRFGNLIHQEPDLIHYSPEVDVLTWGKQKHSAGKKI
jgi:uncharacterized protein